MERGTGRAGIAKAVWPLVAIALLTGVGWLAWWQFRQGGAGSLDWRDPLVVAQGRAIYERECANCHGAKLEGQPDWRNRLPNGRLPAPPHDASGHTWHHPSGQLVDIVRHGLQAFAPAGYQSDMPAYAGRLSDAEIRAVLAFIKSTWPDEVRRRHDEIDRRNAQR